MNATSGRLPDDSLSAILPIAARRYAQPDCGRAAIFTIFVVAYLFYLGKSLTGCRGMFSSVPIVYTICLLSSSLTIHMAAKCLPR
jgi:cytochrome c oxidase subunit 3/cytochrome o ubiquinol oxidase subunit 3